MDIQALGMLSNITAIVQKQNVNTIENDINVENDFCGTLREQQINCVKEDIYNKFHIDVGAANGYFECYIPSDVLYKMNTDTALRQQFQPMYLLRSVQNISRNLTDGMVPMFIYWTGLCILMKQHHIFMNGMYLML